jgi:hypothetical protein
VTKARTVRLIEIAELLGVIHQRTSVIVRHPDFPAPVGRGVRSVCGIGARSCVGEGMAA